MRRSTAFMFAAAALAATLGALAPVLAQSSLPQGDGERRLALRKLSVLASVLYVGAHPDDENTAMLAYLAKERLARTGYLSLTRGDGGQNLIGTEQGELLGLIRTEELLAARRIDGAEQLFTRTIDFGYSKSPEETLAIWGHEAALADVVWAIRSFRPDVIVTRFPANGDGGHGQHTASAILAREAFDAAADPARFPEQLSLVRPWQAKRLLWNGWRRDGDTRPVVPGTIQVDLGTYSPALGQSYTELAAAGRSMHKSQGFGSRERRGTSAQRPRAGRRRPAGARPARRRRRDVGAGGGRRRRGGRAGGGGGGVRRTASGGDRAAAGTGARGARPGR